MSKIKDGIKKIVNRDDFIFIVIICIYGLMNFVLPVLSDDELLRQKYAGLSIWKEKELIINDYLYWSSRVIVNCVVHIILRVSQNIWAILDAGVLFVLLKSMSKLFAVNNKKKVNLVIGILFVLYPYHHMASAGWVTGSITYFWVLAAGFLGLIPIRKIINKEKFKKWEYIIYSLALIFAANQEQMVIILLFIYSIFTIYMLITKKISKYIVIQTALCIASLVFIMTAPGNSARSNSELWRFKDYGMLSLIGKLQLGFTATMEDLLLKPTVSIVFLLLSILLLFAITKKYKNKFYSLISSVPILSIVGIFVLQKLGISKGYLLQPINKYGIVNIENYTSITTYFKVFIMCLMICSIIISLYLLFENTYQSLFMILILLIGLASRVAMGFSPTIWASAERTFIFFYFIIIAISCNVYNYCLEKEIIEPKDELVINSSLITYGIVSFYQLVQTIIV